MSEIEDVDKTEEVKEIWFAMLLAGNPIRNNNDGKVTLFSAEDVHKMIINPNIPMSWWATREFARYTGE